MNIRHKENKAERLINEKNDQWSDKMISGIFWE